MSAAAFGSANCQLPVASCQLSPVCHVFAQFASLRFGSLWFFWPLCAFSADQTNFAHFGMPRMQMPFLSPNYTIHHISFDSTSRSQTVKESKRERFPLTLSLPLCHSLYAVSFSLRMCFQFAFLAKLVVGVFNGISCDARGESRALIEVNFIGRGKQFNSLQSVGKT